jgi:hypothetical protein
MIKYKALFPFIPDMGSVSPIIVWDKTFETKEEEALWHLNGMREYDGLIPLDELPEGTTFQVLTEE